MGNEAKKQNCVNDAINPNDFLDKETRQLLLESTCKIKNDSKIAFGFFCKLPVGRFRSLSNFLIILYDASYGVLSQEDVSTLDDIIIEINNQEKVLIGKNRKTYYNSELNYSCIEIFETDNIKNFFITDKLNIGQTFNKESYINKSIIIIGIMKNEQIGFYDGKIKNLRRSKFLFEANLFPENYKGIILNPNSNTIIGFHTSVSKNIFINKNFGVGIFMKNIFNDIYKISNNDIIYKPIKYDISFKIILGGDTYSGKTSYINQLDYRSIQNAPSTITSDKLAKYININDLSLCFMIWDGPRWVGRFDSIIKINIKNTDGFFLLFSLYEQSSFDNIDICIKLIKETLLDISNIPILLLGTHADSEKKVQSKEAIEYAKKNNFIGYFEVSSLTGENAQHSFEFLTKCIYLINIENKKLSDIEFKISLSNHI